MGVILRRDDGQSQRRYPSLALDRAKCLLAPLLVLPKIASVRPAASSCRYWGDSRAARLPRNTGFWAPSLRRQAGYAPKVLHFPSPGTDCPRGGVWGECPAGKRRNEFSVVAACSSPVHRAPARMSASPIASSGPWSDSILGGNLQIRGYAVTSHSSQGANSDSRPVARGHRAGARAAYQFTVGSCVGIARALRCHDLYQRRP